MNCADFMAEIGNYLDGETAAGVKATLEQHLAHCRTCTVVVDSARKTLRIVTEVESFELEDVALKPVQDRIMARIRGVGPR